MDTLILKDCRFSCNIGIVPKERNTRQPVLIDIELTTDTKKAAKSDSIQDTVDYLLVYKKLKECVESRPYNLVEAMGEQVSKVIFKNFPITSITLTIKKTKPMKGRGAWAGIRMTRTK